MRIQGAKGSSERNDCQNLRDIEEVERMPKAMIQSSENKHLNP